MKLHHATLILRVLPLFALTACGDLLPTTSGTFTDVYAKTLSSCTQCHDGSNATEYGSLDFSTQASAYETLVGTTVTGPMAAGTCGQVPLVAAGSPSTSYLTAVLFTDYAASFSSGGCVPYATHLEDQSISPEEKTSIETWITNGAAND
jgi:hypothetical protein